MKPPSKTNYGLSIFEAKVTIGVQKDKCKIPTAFICILHYLFFGYIYTYCCSVKFSFSWFPVNCALFSLVSACRDYREAAVTVVTIHSLILFFSVIFLSFILKFPVFRFCNIPTVFNISKVPNNRH